MIDTALIAEVVLITVKVVVVGLVLFAMPIPLTWLERKVAGHIQVRLGPYRVGFHGLLQPFADAIKLLTKEDMVPERADRVLFKLAPILALAPICAVFVVIPVGESWMLPFIDKEISLYVSDMNVGALYILAISGLGIYGIIFGGWASNSKYALLGGLRSAAQMISYEVAMSFAFIGVIMLTNTLSLVEIVRAQAGGVLNWNIFYLPVGPVWFAIFLISGLAEINRIPFDLPEDEGTLGSGFHVEYSGMRFAYFQLAEYLAMVSVSLLAVLFFFGGWDAPLGIPLPPIVWFLAKVSVFIYFFMWVRFTIPRYRYDQLMGIGWKVLIPLSMVNILVTGLMVI